MTKPQEKSRAGRKSEQNWPLVTGLYWTLLALERLVTETRARPPAGRGYSGSPRLITFTPSPQNSLSLCQIRLARWLTRLARVSSICTHERAHRLYRFASCSTK